MNGDLVALLDTKAVIESNLQELNLEKENIHYEITHFLLKHKMTEFFTVNWRKLYKAKHDNKLEGGVVK